MYAEDDEELKGTLRHICENLKNFPEYDDISVEWNEIAVCVVSDGRQKADKRCLEYAESIGIFDKRMMLDHNREGVQLDR